METFERFCVLAAAALLAACGQPDEQSGRATPQVEETVFDDMMNTMEKARAVDETTMQHKEALDRALQESEGAEGA